MIKKIFKIILPVIVIVSAIYIFNYYIHHTIKPEKNKIANKGVIVKVLKVENGDFPVEITEFGNVVPFQKFNIIPQVSGKIVYISKNFIKGNFIKKGEIILKIEDIDYRAKYFQALKEYKEAKLNYEKIKELAEISKRELIEAKKEFKIAKPSKLKLFIPQLQAAEAKLEAAKVSLKLAKKIIERTEIKAPFNGIVVTKNVEKGEFVLPGKLAGTIYNSNKVEIYAKIPDFELPFIDMNHKNVKIIFETGDFKYKFNGIISRTSKIINKNTRSMDVIIDFFNPFKKLKNNITLFYDSFVKVLLNGKTFKNIAKIPAYAIHRGDEVWIYKNQRLIIKKIDVIKITENYAYVRGLNNGDFIIITNLPYVTNGMKVRVANEMDN